MIQVPGKDRTVFIKMSLRDWESPRFVLHCLKNVMSKRLLLLTWLTVYPKTELSSVEKR